MEDAGPVSSRATPPVPRPALPPEAGPIAQNRRLAVQLRIFGIVAFWLQVLLGLIAALLLIVTASSNYYDANRLNLSPGVSLASGSLWGHLAILILVLTIIGFYLFIREAQRLKHADAVDGEPRTRRLVAGVSVGNALGLTAAILGTAFSIALLVAKTVSQPPGIAITDPQKIVRAVDVFVLLANFIIVVAHFFGVLASLWILNRIYRLDAGKTDSDVGG